MMNCGIASGIGETAIGELKEDTPVRKHSLMDRVLIRHNLINPENSFKRNKRSPRS